jgi:glycopeptide antibiotics resistance protein
MLRRSPLRGMAIAIFVIIISFFNFSRLTGSECIRTIHVVTLLTCGAGIGIFLANLFRLMRKNEENK